MNAISSSDNTWRTRHFRRVDRLLWMPAIAHYAFNLIVAFFTDTLVLALAVGLAAFPPLLLLHWRRPDSRFNAYGKAVLYMVLSALLIEQSGGFIEAHFSIFIMLAVLILYADWRVILVGAATIAVHHLLFTFLQYHGLVQLYQSTLGGHHGSHLDPGELIACLLMHAGAVVAETTVLSYLALVLKSMIKDGESVARFAAEAGDGRLDHAFERQELARPMVATVHTMRERIVETLQQASATAEEVSELGVALVAGGDELRTQVESNVSQVEEISSVATQFSATSREYAQEASTVRGLAETAAGHARRGSRTMEAQEESMAVIRRDTQNIVALLGDIDQITFQTNLLALNASVEAARAGEQGRGFAVVAGEVRTLASRTQEVARQIRGSISEMAESVEASVESGGTASEAMRDVIGTFKQVVERLHDIDITSQEQQRGIEDLEQSVQKFHSSLGASARQLDENHAMARRLSASADELMAAVGKFRLPDRQVAGTRMLLPESLLDSRGKDTRKTGEHR